MQEQTATRRLTKRANDFLGISFESYIIRFTHVKELPSGEKYIWLNDNATMQKTFAVWLGHGNRKAGLIAYHALKAE
jgi:hypothetical protein